MGFFLPGRGEGRTLGRFVYVPHRPSIFLNLEFLHPNGATLELSELLLGRRYNRVKKKQGSNNQHVQEKSEKGQNDPFQTTAEKLAIQHGVSPATVKRARGATAGT